jgi:hypothetical protein
VGEDIGGKEVRTGGANGGTAGAGFYGRRRSVGH